MPNDPLNDNLLEIENHLRELTPEQRDRILDWIKNGKAKTAKIQSSVNALQESLDTLRVHIKYTMFDLEATRRERDFLRDQLTDLHDELCSRGYYAEDEIMPGMLMLPPSEDGLIDLPDTGDYIHSNECDHPYDSNCVCYHCEAVRDRRGAEGSRRGLRRQRVVAWRPTGTSATSSGGPWAPPWTRASDRAA